MKLYILMMLLASVILSACNNLGKQSNIVGVYVNTFENNVTHYVELKKDSTFLHYYKKYDEKVAKENRGIWKLSITPEKTEIIFDPWFDFGHINNPSCNGCLSAVELKDGMLIFNYDIPDEVNFIKKK